MKNFDFVFLAIRCDSGPLTMRKRLVFFGKCAPSVGTVFFVDFHYECNNFRSRVTNQIVFFNISTAIMNFELILECHIEPRWGYIMTYFAVLEDDLFRILFDIIMIN